MALIYGVIHIYSSVTCTFTASKHSQGYRRIQTEILCSADMSVCVIFQLSHYRSLQRAINEHNYAHEKMCGIAATLASGHTTAIPLRCYRANIREKTNCSYSHTPRAYDLF